MDEDLAAIEYVWPNGHEHPSFMKVGPKGLLVRDFALQLEFDLGITAQNAHGKMNTRRHFTETHVIVQDPCPPHSPLPYDLRLEPGAFVQVRRVHAPRRRRRDHFRAGKDRVPSTKGVPGSGAGDAVHVYITHTKGMLAWVQVPFYGPTLHGALDVHLVSCVDPGVPHVLADVANKFRPRVVVAHTDMIDIVHGWAGCRWVFARDDTIMHLRRCACRAARHATGKDENPNCT